MLDIFENEEMSVEDLVRWQQRLSDCFRCKHLLRFFKERDGALITPQIPSQLHGKLLGLLALLTKEDGLADVGSNKSNCLSKMKGPYKDYYSIRLNQHHRLVFRWEHKVGARDIQHVPRKNIEKGKFR